MKKWEKVHLALVWGIIAIIVFAAATPTWKSVSYDSANGNAIRTLMDARAGLLYYGSNVAVDTDARFTDARTPLAHTQAATTITQDTTHRFVTDADTAGWNAAGDMHVADNLAGVDPVAARANLGLLSAAIHADTEYEDAGAVSGHESAYDHSHYNDAYNAIHSHANKSTIDGIASDSLADWDAHDAYKIQGRTVSGAAPTDKQGLVWNDSLSKWEPGAAGHTVQDAGTTKTQRSNLNFKSGFVVGDNSGSDSTEISVSTVADSDFVNANLATGILTVSGTNTIAHVVDNNGIAQLLKITYGSSTTAVDLSDFGAISGTWKVKFAQGLGGGSSGMSNPMTAAGDMIYGGTSGTPTRLAKGTDGQVLTLASGAPAWGAAPSSGGSDGSTYSLTTNHTMLASEVGYHFVYAASTDTERTFTLCAPPVNNSAPVWIKNNETSYAQTISGHINGTSASTFILQPDSEIKLVSEGQTWRVIMDRWRPTAATNAHTFAGINGDSDIHYSLKCFARNSGAGGDFICMYFNSDQTASNYFSYRNYPGGGGSVSNKSGVALSFVDGATTNISILMEMYSGSGYRRITTTNGLRDINASDMSPELIGGVWKSTDNITSLTVTGTTNCFDVGTCVELWKTGELR